MRSIDSQSITKSIDRNRSIDIIFDQSTSGLPEGPDISKSLCDPNQNLISMDINGRRPPTFVRLELILDDIL
jgi:hypothetical protein